MSEPTERVTAADWRFWAEGFQEGWDQAHAEAGRRAADALTRLTEEMGLYEPVPPPSAGALAAARADERQRWVTAIEGLADEIELRGLHVHNPSADAADRLRTLTDGEKRTAKGAEA